MKICFLEGDMSRRGGTERMTAFLSNSLCENNTVYVISLSMRENNVFFSLGDNVTHICLKSSNTLGRICEIHRIIKNQKIDVIINVDAGMGYIGILASTLTKARVITWEHANFYNNWNSAVFPYLRSFAAKHSDCVVVLTERDKDNYKGNIRGCAPVYVIPNPCEGHEFIYDINSKTILSAGLFNPVKRFELIPDIAEKVFSKHGDWRWVICGDGPEYETVKNKISDMVLEDNIILRGSVSDMEGEYNAAAMFVMTSETEGLPMVLLEAKSYGLPIVSFDIMTGPSDIIRDKVNGFLVQSCDTAAMAEKICELIEDESKRSSFSEATQLDMDKFSVKEVNDRWQTLLNSL